MSPKQLARFAIGKPNVQLDIFAHWSRICIIGLPEVLGMRTSAYKFPSGRELTRIPHLASPLLRINLAEELRRLRSEQSWKRGSGRSSKTLAKYPDFHMVLVLMKANTQMHKHHVDAR